LDPLADAELVGRVHDVEELVLALVGRLVGADVESAVDHERVGADELEAVLFCDGFCDGGLAACRGAHDGDEERGRTMNDQ
jgi:hypothetical protein